MSESQQRNPEIIVVGGGFGGVRAAERLAAHSHLNVTLISSQDHFSYYPQLYHSATGGARTESALPLAELLEGTKVKFVQDTITALDPEAQTVSGSSGAAYHYNELILALGSVTNYFGIKGLQEFSYDIKTIAGAERFKEHLHKDLIEDNTPDPNYVIVGGGPTGVELAAALGDYLKRIIRLHGIKTPKYTINLVEAAPRILPRSAEGVSARVQKRLEKNGVKVMTNTAVQAETADALMIAGQALTTQTVVWTAGVSNNPFFKSHAELFKLAKNGKVEVDEHLQARPHVYVIGDNAATQYSGMAQTAIHDADYVTYDLLRSLRTHPRPAYKAKAPISVIPVGHMWAAVQWGNVQLYGLIGYALRRAADLIAYGDIEPWPKAIKVWLQDSIRQDNCSICQPGIPDPTPVNVKNA